MASLLENLGFKKKIRVGISVSVNNFVELVCIDDATRSVVRYTSGNVKYNTAIREIMDFDEFHEVIDSLFAEAGLNPSECSVTLTLPNVHFGVTSIETNYEIPYLIENIQTEIEDLYIFKRSEPAISFSVLEASRSRNQLNVAFSAMQSVLIGRIVEIFDSLQIELERIDSSYSSFLRTLQYCDRFSKYFEKEESTAIVLVTPGSCAAFYMRGNELIDFAEEALAIKSLSTEEVYASISKIASGMISKHSPRTLLAVSETDEINAEQLVAGLNFSGETDFFNKGISSSETFISVSTSQHGIDPNMVSYLTLEAVGAAASSYMDFPLSINFLPEERINKNLIKVSGYEIDMNKFIVIVLIASIAAGALLGGAVKLILGAQVHMFQNSANQAEADIGIFKRKIDEGSGSGAKSAFPILKKMVDSNNKIIDTYNMLSADLVDGVYIKRFVANSNGELGIYGVAKSAALASDFATTVREHNNELLFSSVSLDASQDLFASAIGQNDGINFELKTANFTLNTLNEALDDINNTMQQVNPASAPQNNYGSDFMAPPPPVI